MKKYSRSLNVLISHVQFMCILIASLTLILSQHPHRVAAQAALPNNLTAIAEANSYVVVYDLAIPTGAVNFNASGIPYSIDNSASTPSFNRVAYYLELTQGGNSQYVYVSFDALETDATRIGVPAVSSGVLLQESVTSLNIYSNVPGLATGTNIDGGTIEFWSNNYSPYNQHALANASDDLFDFGDYNDGAGGPGYGSMQLHNAGAQQTIFAFNGWGNGQNPDLGIGNQQGGSGHPDWTFAANAERYEARRLVVLVRPTAVSITEAPQEFQLYPRNPSTNRAEVPIAGQVLSSSYSAIRVDVYRESALVESLTEPLNFTIGAAAFRLTPQIPAELANYHFEISAITNGAPQLIKRINNVVAGDIFVINGQSNAEAWAFNGSANFNRNQFIRSFGTSSAEAAQVASNRDWHWAEGDIIFSSGSVGQWGLRLGRLIMEEQGIPVAIFNGGHGGQAIPFFQRNDGNHYDLSTNYGRLLTRLTNAHVVGDIRALLWYQGESDAYQPQVHKSGFESLYADWRSDLGDVPIYVHQIRSDCGGGGMAVREIQRRFADTLSNVTVMSTTAIDGHDGCHFAYVDGYEVIAQHIYGMLERDFYGAPNNNVEPPNPSNAYFSRSDDTEITIVMRNSADTLVWEAGAQQHFKVEGTTVTVVGGNISGNRLILRLSGSAPNALGISYLGHDGAGPWVTNAKGIGLLAFDTLPLTSAGALSLANPGSQTHAVGNLVSLQVQASGSTGTLQYAAEGLPSGLSINSSSGRISGTPTTVGSFAVTASVSDGNGGADSVTFTWSITSAPPPPGGGSDFRHVKLVAESELNGNPWSSAAEFNVLDATGAPLSRTGWSITTNSQETIGEDGRAANAIDGNVNTIWHTQWMNSSPAHPHYIQVNLGATRTIGGFRYLPPQVGSPNGTIINYKFYGSNNATNWTLLAQGAFAADSTEKNVMLSGGGGGGGGGSTNGAPSLTSPGNQSSTMGAAVNLPLSASDPDGNPLTFNASGLPNGLSINSGSGLISGSPVTAGSFTVTASVSDGNGGADSITFTWTIHGAGAPGCQGLEREAESATLRGNFVIGSDAAASGGQYVHVPEGTGDALDSLPTAQKLDYCFTVTNAGVYRLLGWVHAAGGYDDSFYVQVDGQPATAYLWDTAINSNYAADYVNARNGADPVEVTLSPGEHTISIFLREDGTRLDKLAIEAVDAPRVFSPGDQSSTAGNGVALTIQAVNPTASPLTFSASGLPAGLSINALSGEISGQVDQAGTYNVVVTVTGENGVSNSANFVWFVNAPPQSGCSGTVREAEDGALFGDFTMEADSAASGGHFIHVPEGAGNDLDAQSLSTRAEYCFTVSVGGSYRLIGWVLAANGYDDSFFVRINGQPAGGYLWDTQITTEYAADYLNERNGSDPVEFALEPGEQTITIYLREDGTRLDKLSLELVSAVNAVNAAQQVPEQLLGLGIVGTIGADELAEMTGGATMTATLSDVKSRGDIFSATVPVDAAGRFYFDRMPVGDYRLVFNVPAQSQYSGATTFTLTASEQSLMHFGLGMTSENMHQLYLPLLTR